MCNLNNRMKEKKLDKMIIKEALWFHLGSFAVEEIVRASGIGLSRSLSESEFIDLFQKKYAKAIRVAEKTFSDEMERKVFIQDPEFFSIENIKNEIYTRSPDSLKESKNMGNGILSDLIFESSIKYAEGGLGDPKKLVTSQVQFQWGKYNYPDPNDVNFKNKSKIASANYWIKDGESNLGSIQFKGDPFTYAEAGGGKLEVISAPGSTDPTTGKSYRESIGNIFSLSEKDSKLGGSYEISLEAINSIVDSIVPPDEEFKSVEKEFGEEIVGAALESRKEKIVKSVKDGFDNGNISVIAWAALDEQAGIDDFIKNVIYNTKRNIFSQGLIRRRPEICLSRLGMVMIILAEKINILGRKSIRSFNNQQDPIFQMLFTLEDEDLDPENLLNFLYYIEDIKNRIVETILDEFIPLANMAAYDRDDADKPSSYIASIFSSRDKCGYLINPDPEEEDPYGSPARRTVQPAHRRVSPGSTGIENPYAPPTEEEKERVRQRQKIEDEKLEDEEVNVSTEDLEEEPTESEIERAMRDRGYSM